MKIRKLNGIWEIQLRDDESAVFETSKIEQQLEISDIERE